MDGLLEADAPLVVSLVREPTPDKLRQLFARRTTKWRHPQFEVERGGIGLFADLEQAIEPAQAWALIPTALELTRAQTDRDLLEVSLSLLLGLARASDTTAQPAPLEAAWSALVAHVDHADGPTGPCRPLLREIQRWYRVGVQRDSSGDRETSMRHP